MPRRSIECVYLDLFDDGIPQRNILLDPKSPTSFDAELLNNARFQILLTVLFGGYVVVPESWLVSSPTFLRLMTEIQQHYKPRTYRKSAAGPEPVECPPIFKFAFFDPNRGARSPAQRFVQTLSKRLELGRPIIALNGLIGADGESLPPEGRDAIAENLKNLLPLRTSIEPGRLRDALTGGINLFSGQSGSSQRAELLCSGYMSVVEYMESRRGEDVLQAWGPSGEARYRDRLAEQVGLVSTALSPSSDLAARYPDEVNKFAHFFREVKARQISFADVMGMRALLQHYDPATRRTISAFGRYVLNRGYGHGAKAQSLFMSFDFYPQTKPSDFERELLREVARKEHQAFETTVMPEFLELAPGRPYLLADSINWRSVWRTLADVVTDPEWLAARASIEDRLFEHELDSASRDPELWQELFDRVNSRFNDFTFRVTGGTHPSVEVLLKSLDGIKDVVVPGLAVGQAISDSTKTIAELTTSSLKMLLLLGGRFDVGYRIIRLTRMLRAMKGTAIRLRAKTGNIVRRV